MTARARACSLPDSRPARRARTSSSPVPASSGSTRRTWGRPAVSVPVLSKKTVRTCPLRSMTSPPRTSTPARAARPMARAVASGVAMPIAHGQATTRTASAAKPACRGPSMQSHARPATAASTRTAGTKTAAAALGQPLGGRRPSAGLLDHRDDAAQEQVLAHGPGLDDHRRRPVDGPGQALIAGAAGRGARLAREGRLLDDRGPLEDAAVDGEPLAGPDLQAVAGAAGPPRALLAGHRRSRRIARSGRSVSRLRTSRPARALAVASRSLPKVTSASSIVAVSK